MAMVDICFLVVIPYFFLWLALADSKSSLSNIINLWARLFLFGCIALNNKWRVFESWLKVMSCCCGGVLVMLPVKVTCRDGHLSHPTQREGGLRHLMKWISDWKLLRHSWTYYHCFEPEWNHWSRKKDGLLMVLFRRPSSFCGPAKKKWPWLNIVTIALEDFGLSLFTQLQSLGVVAEEHAVPIVCNSQKNRLEKVVRYYFLGDTAMFILGCCQVLLQFLPVD